MEVSLALDCKLRINLGGSLLAQDLGFRVYGLGFRVLLQLAAAQEPSGKAATWALGDSLAALLDAFVALLSLCSPQDRANFPPKGRSCAKTLLDHANPTVKVYGRPYSIAPRSCLPVIPCEEFVTGFQP